MEKLSENLQDCIGSEKQFNILTTILEECNEDVHPNITQLRLSDQSDSTKSSDSDATLTETSCARQGKDGQRKKKVAFVLPIKKEEIISPMKTTDEGKLKLNDMRQEKQIERCLSKGRVDQYANQRLRTLKTVFDILEMPHLSEIFKDLESDCCEKNCLETHRRVKSRIKTRQKKKSKPKMIKQLKSVNEIYEHKCDHSKIMRNEDGTRKEVDHDFRNSTNPVMLSWLEKKKKVEREKRKEEKRERKKERKEKKMQLLAKAERKHLSDTLVKDWVRKKKKELSKRLATRKIEPDGASHSSIDEKQQHAPLGYTLIETFSSAGSPSQLCMSDSGISSSSVTSPHNSYCSASTAYSIHKKGQNAFKAKPHQAPNLAQSYKKSDMKSSMRQNSVHGSSSIRQGPKYGWTEKTTFSKGIPRDVVKETNAGQQQLRSDSSIIQKSSLFQQTKGSKDNKKKKSKKIKSKRKQDKDNVVTVAKEDKLPHSSIKTTSSPRETCHIDAIESSIVVKERRRRLDEKLKSKKRVISRIDKKSISPPVLEKLPSKYSWLSDDSDFDSTDMLSKVGVDGILDNSPEPQGSDESSKVIEAPESNLSDVNQSLNTKDVSNSSIDRKRDKKFDEHNASDSDLRKKEVSEQNSNEIIKETDRTTKNITVPIILDQSQIDKNHSMNTDKLIYKKESTMDQYNEGTNKEDLASYSDLTSSNLELSTSEESDACRSSSSLSSVERVRSKDFNDCIDFFLEDYRRPWMQL